MKNKWINLLNNQNKEVLKYSYIDNEGVQYTTNTHVLIAMNDGYHLSVDTVPAGRTFPNVKSFIPNTEWGNLNILDFNLIKNPIKFNEEKRKSKTNPYIYKLKDNYGHTVTVDNDYLKMVLSLLGNDSKVYAIGSTRPVLIESEKGKAIIMPIIKN